MAIMVNNNTQAFGIWSNFSNNTSKMQKAMNHLSTGEKKVVDDPSGVGISERMRSQAKNVSMARNNVDNGLSLLQTADSWMQKINDMLSRMSELAIEAGDGTKTSVDKNNIQTEFKQLQDEISRVTSGDTAAAKFNGLFLFRGGDGVTTASTTGNDGSIDLQVGPDANQKVSLTLLNLAKESTASIDTGVQWGSIIDSSKGFSVSNSNAIAYLSKAIDHISNQRATNGAQQNRLENTKSGLLSYEDNLRAAESKIRDVDMARESTTFQKFQILNQVSNAMLAQANQLPSQVMQLVG